MKKSTWGTSLLDCQYMVIHPIMPFGLGSKDDSERFGQMNLEFWNTLLPTAKQYGVILCLENMPFPELISSTPKATLQMVDDLYSEYMAFCLDTGHCAVLGCSPTDAVRMAGSRLKAIHVHGNDGKNDLHCFPLHNGGSIDWKSFRMAMHDASPEIPLSLERDFNHRIPNPDRDLLLQGLAKLAAYLAE